jgi:cytochrome c biogenesis protein CcdA
MSRVITKVSAFSWAHVWLNRLLGLCALILAWLSFRDAWRARQGRLAEMSLQMPEYLKSRIRGVIRENSRAANFVLAAFASGAVVSFLGLACTGQVYLPTLVYMVNQGSASAVFWLIFYNLAYIVPLLIVFFLAYTGIKSDALIHWQKKNTALVRVVTGCLFLALWVVLMVV